MSEAPHVEAAAARVRDSERAIIEAKHKHTEALAADRRHRTAVQAAVKAWLAEWPTLTPLGLAQQTIRANQQEKADIAAGLAPPRQEPPQPIAYIDRVCLASGSGGSSDDFARSRMKTGFHRGAFTRKEAEYRTAQFIRSRTAAADAAAPAAQTKLGRKW
jgi:hypothetical protein